jgi:WD40 repeat protein
MLSGVLSLGGMAYSAARSRVGDADLWFSRSAPASSGGGANAHARRASVGSFTPHGSGGGGGGGEPVFTVAPPHEVSSASGSKVSAGYHITILDLAPLLSPPPPAPSPPAGPTIISSFAVSKQHPINNIEFTHDGNSVIISTEDGKVIRVFQVRPVASVLRGGNTGSSHNGNGGGGASEPWHIYNLRRGRTSAVVEGMKASEDGRWVAVGTRKGTVHVFAVNPYGGKPDQRSHLEGRVVNVSELVSIDFSPFFSNGVGVLNIFILFDGG